MKKIILLICLVLLASCYTMKEPLKRSMTKAEVRRAQKGFPFYNNNKSKFMQFKK